MLLHASSTCHGVDHETRIAFANLKDPAREFGPVRVMGHDWVDRRELPFIFILVNWSKVPSMSDVGFIDWLGKHSAPRRKVGSLDRPAVIFLVAGLASFVLAAISPTLPPPRRSRRPGRTASRRSTAAKLLKYPFVAVLFLVTFIDAAVHQSFLLDRVVPEDGRRHPGELGPAGHEDRADRGNPDDAHPGLRA